MAGPTIEHIPIARIQPSPFQVRKDFDEKVVANLMDSIQVVGLLHPIVVRPLGDGNYEVLAGHHRLEALRRLGHLEAPAIVRAATDEEARLILRQENHVRRTMDPMETAKAILLDIEAATGLGRDEARSAIVKFFKKLPVPEPLARAIGGVLRAYGLTPMSFYIQYRNILDMPATLVEELPPSFRTLRRLGEVGRYIRRWTEKVHLGVTSHRFPLPEGMAVQDLFPLVGEALALALRRYPMPERTLLEVIRGKRGRGLFLWALEFMEGLPPSVSRHRFLETLVEEMVLYHRDATEEALPPLEDLAVGLLPFVEAIQAEVEAEHDWRKKLWAAAVVLPLSRGALKDPARWEALLHALQEALREERQALAEVLERLGARLQDLGLLERSHRIMWGQAITLGGQERDVPPALWWRDQAGAFQRLLLDLKVPEKNAKAWGTWLDGVERILQEEGRVRHQHKLLRYGEVARGAYRNPTLSSGEPGQWPKPPDSSEPSS